MLQKAIRNRFLLLGFFILLFGSVKVVSADTISPDALLGIYKNYVIKTENPLTTTKEIKSEIKVNDVLSGYKNYVTPQVINTPTPKISSTPQIQIVKNTNTPTLQNTSPKITNAELISALRNLIVKGNLPEDIKNGLRGPQGPTGVQGIQGPAGTSPYNFYSAQPTTQNNPGPIGLLGGFAALGVQDLNSTTLKVSGNSTISGSLTVTGMITGNLTGNVTGSINPSFTLGSVAFQGASGLTQDNTNFFWDDTNNRLGIGTNTPQSVLSVSAATNSGSAITGLASGTTYTPFFINTSLTDSTALTGQVGSQVSLSINPDGAWTGKTVRAGFWDMVSLASNANNLGTLQGGLFQTRHDGTGTATSVVGLGVSALSATGSGAISQIIGIQGSSRFSSTGSNGTMIGNTNLLTFNVAGTATSITGYQTTLSMTNGATVSGDVLLFNTNSITNTASTIAGKTVGYYVGDITAGTQTGGAYSVYNSDASAPMFNAGVFQNSVGAVGTPSYTFAGDLTTGLYQTGTAGTIGVASSGVNVVTFGTPSGSSSTSNFLNVTGTLPSTLTAATDGVSFSITPAGSSSFSPAGLSVSLRTGYTGSVKTYGITTTNNTSGTGTTPWTNGGFNGGMVAFTTGTGAGNNVAVFGSAQNSSSLNIGGLFRSISAISSPALNVAVAGLATNATTNVGGFFGLANAAPTLSTSAALIADNAAEAADIFQARDNGTQVFTIMDGGNVGIGTTNPTTKLHLLTDDANNTSTTSLVTINKTTSGVAGNNIGSGIDFNIENSAGTLTTANSIRSTLSNATSGNEKSSLVIRGRTDGGAIADFLTITPTSANSSSQGIVFNTVTGNLTLAQNGGPTITSSAELTLSGSTVYIPSSVQIGRNGFSYNGSLRFFNNAPIIFGPTSDALDQSTYFYSDNTARLAIISGGNVGIGTTNPVQKLDVSGNINISSTNALTFGGTGQHSSITGTTSTLSFQSNSNQGTDLTLSGNGGATLTSNSAGNGAQYDFIVTSASTRTAGGLMTVRNNGSGLFYIDYNGNVGINTSGTQNSKLDILPTGTYAAAGISGITSRAHTVTLSGANPTTYATFYGNQIGAMTLAGTNAGQTVTDAAGLNITSAPIKSTNVALTNTHGLLISAGAVSTATNSYGLTVNTQTGATNNYAAAFLGGNVGIGTTSPQQTLDVNGSMNLADNASISWANSCCQPKITDTGNASIAIYNNASATAAIDITTSRITLNSQDFGSAAGSTVINTNNTINSGNLLSINNNTTQKFVVSYAGNIGVGTGTATAKVDILSTGTFAAAGVSGINQQAHTVTLSGADPTTYATFYGSQIDAMTLVGTNSNQTVTNAAGLVVAPAIKSTNIALTNTHGILIPATSVSTATNAYGITVNTPTGATNNYAAAFLGGNVGIGTTSPGSLLDVNGGRFNMTSTGVAHGMTDVAPTNAYSSMNYTDSYLGGIQLYGITDADGTAINLTAISGATDPTDSTPTFVLQAGKDNGVTSWTSLGALETAFQFKNFSTNLLTILGSGNVGIGTTNPDTKLHLYNTDDTVYLQKITSNTASGDNKFITFRTDTDTERGSITFNRGGTAVLYNQSSDQRLKENIVPTHYGLSDLMNIQVSDFSFINDPNHNTTNGFIAQQLYAIYPTAVSVGGDDPNKNPWMVDYGRITPLIVKAVQDLNIKIDGIEDRVAALEANTGNLSSFGSYALDFFNSGVQSVVDGIVYMKGIVTEKLTIGSPTKRTGVTFYDEVTGEPFCMSVANGIQKIISGECVIIEVQPPSQNNSGESNSGSPTDTTPPVINLNGDTTINLTLGSVYEELGATATDETDGSVAVIISGSVDTNTLGTYTIHYNATDSANNVAVEMTRTVNITE